MEDRYLFKAKFDDSDRWVKGWLVKINDNYFIIPGYASKISAFCFSASNIIEVKKDTICQCTGLKDKNGKLIWENDIVKGKYYDNGKSHRHIGQVKYIYEAYKVVGVKQYTGYHAHLDGSYEVIGNIFDNKELLESEDKDENNY